ncbi:hypothetical protein BC834DRAFT_861300 [Gloeopeniophorella convolvens]|nr:hypothetical protein BC834DRAFT_861300 [Gloeopeniophorella convolvens]
MHFSLVDATDIGNFKNLVSFDIEDLVPYTLWRHKSSTFDRNPDLRHYWEEDIYATAAKLHILREKLSCGVPGSEEALRKFCNDRKRIATAAVKDANKYHEWVTKAVREQKLDNIRRKMARYEAVKERLLEAGYDVADAAYGGLVRKMRCVWNVGTLTEIEWQVIKSRVEAQVAENSEKRRRAALQIMAAKTRARTVLKDALERYLPVQRFYLPSFDQASALPCLSNLINEGRAFDSEDWGRAVNVSLDQDLSIWMTVRRNSCANMLPGNRADFPIEPMRPTLLSDPLADTIRSKCMSYYSGCLELATSVFTHKTTAYLGLNVYIGRNLFDAWKTLEVDLFEFSPRGAFASACLLQQSNLPSSTSAQLLDILPRCFVCANCIPYHVLSWRSCVRHFAFADQDTHATPKFYPLGADDLMMSPSFSSSLDPPSDQWLCNHCSLLSNAPKFWVVSHLLRQ